VNVEPAPVAVVIPSWNSADLLPGLLDSLVGQAGVAEIHVVDNGSADGTLDLLWQRRVEYTSLPRNEGFARAMNLGAARTAAPAILALNADTVLGPGSVAALARALGADPSVAGVQPRILQMEGAGVGDPERARLYSAGQALTADGRAVEAGAGEEQVPRFREAREIFGVCGAACLLRRDLFDRLGGYDESYFAFYEDVDLNVRARIAGRRFFYEPEAVVWHLGNTSWLAGAPRPDAWNARLVARNRIATQAKFMPAVALPRIAAVEIGALGRAMSQRRLGGTLRGKVEGLGRIPSSLGERRRLRREGDLRRARAWLGAG
jgi:N-acetylglucosaminyl-diphospho-decaprenol L-rhamnosyltransferase